MEIYLLIFFLVLFLVIQMPLCKFKIFTPAVLLTVCFLISSLDLFTMGNSWNIALRGETVMIIILGIVFFNLGCLSANLSIHNGKIRTRKYNQLLVKDYIVEALEAICKKKILMFCFFLFNVLASGAYALASVRYAISHGAGGSLLYLLAYTQDLQKFHEASFDVPIIISLSFSVCRFSAYIWGILYVQRFFEKKKENGMLLLCLISSVLGQLCVGARGAVVSTVLGLGIYFLFLNDKYKRFHLKIKYLLTGIAGIILVVVAFDYYARITSRISNDYSLWEYVSIYLGAPILNLDSIFGMDVIHSTLFGKNTLNGMYVWLNNRFGITFTGTSTSLGFRAYRNHTLGNVYTTFGYLFIDFGFLGTCFYMYIVGFINQKIYDGARKNRENKPLSISTLLYVYCAPLIFLSFFSNRFSENIVSVDFLHGFISWLIVIYVLKRFSFSKS